MTDHIKISFIIQNIKEITSHQFILEKTFSWKDAKSAQMFPTDSDYAANFTAHPSLDMTILMRPNCIILQNLTSLKDAIKNPTEFPTPTLTPCTHTLLVC